MRIINLLSIKQLSLLFVSVLFFSTKAQPSPSDIKAYIKQYSGKAVDQMVNYKIPASVVLAQAIFESSCGNSYLATKSNNHFGIKCHEDWKGESYIQDDDKKDECFRKYKLAEESYDDHSEFLKSKGDWFSVFERSRFFENRNRKIYSEKK